MAAVNQKQLHLLVNQLIKFPWSCRPAVLPVLPGLAPATTKSANKSNSQAKQDLITIVQILELGLTRASNGYTPGE
jgi:hypothetical protein